MRDRAAWVALATAAIAVCAGPAAAASGAEGAHDWTRFGYDAARTNDAPNGIPAKQVRHLAERRYALPGTADSSPIYLHDVEVGGEPRDLLVVTTSYGITLGLDPASGGVLWQFKPASYSRVAGTYQFTMASPAADPDRRFVYAASPDGLIHKLRVTDGTEVTSGGWPAAVTRDQYHEKINSSLNVSGKSVLVTTGGYFDRAPYQGRVIAISRSTGAVSGVFNSMCSNRPTIFVPTSCPTGSSIWGRAGAVVDPVTHRIYVATANGDFNGRTDWGDSVLELAPKTASLRRHFTPKNQHVLNARDLDLGSTSPALLPAPGRGSGTRYLLQGGKDGRLRLLRLRTSLHGVHGKAGRRLGGQVQDLPSPGGRALYTAPAVLHGHGSTRVYVADNHRTGAYRLKRGRLHSIWQVGAAGTSPVIAGHLLWVYNSAGRLNVYRLGSGHRVRSLPAPPGHWSTPIIAGGRVYMTSGNADDLPTTGTLSIYSQR